MPIAVPRLQTRHLLSRFSYGVTPALVGQAQVAGGARAWFEQQLAPSTVADAQADAIREWLPYLQYSAGRLYEADQSG